jgi:hypothetical protein
MYDSQKIGELRQAQEGWQENTLKVNLDKRS